MAEIVQQAWHRYLLSLQREPLKTKDLPKKEKIILYLLRCSDMFAQKLMGVKNLQLKRSLYMFLYGLLYGGPFGHFFHKLMEKIFPPSRDTKTVVSKVLVEQLTSGPWNNFLFMLYVGLVIEGRPWSLVKSKLRTDYPLVQLNAWRVWPLVGLINYRYLPIHLRVLFHNLAAVCWGTFLILRSQPTVVKKVA